MTFIYKDKKMIFNFNKKNLDQKKLDKIIPKYQAEFMALLKENKAIVIPIMNKYGLDIEIRMAVEPDLAKKYNQKIHLKELSRVNPIIKDGIKALNEKYGVLFLPVFERYELNFNIILQPETKK